MEPGAEQPDDRLAVAANGQGANRTGPVCFVEPPVRPQLPDQEAEHTRQEEHGHRRDARANQRAQKGVSTRANNPGEG